MKHHDDLMYKVAEHREALKEAHGQIGYMSDRMERSEIASNAKLDSILCKAEETQEAIMSLRSLREQFINYVGAFPQEVRNLLQGIAWSNWQIYQVLLQLQHRIPYRPNEFHNPQLSFRFENALGEVKDLPYEIFRDWEVRAITLLAAHR